MAALSMLERLDRTKKVMMRHEWIWLFVSWIMIAGLVGCNQAINPFAAETAPEATSTTSADPIIGTAKPTTTIEPTNTPQIESIATETDLNEEPTLAGIATPSLQPVAIPITLTQVIQEEKVIENTPIPKSADPGVQALVRQAREDLATQLGIDVDQIKTLEVRQVVWPDTSLGCPEEGIAYQQVLQEGLLIRLGVGNRLYFYHSDKTQAPFLCEQTSEIFKKGTPKIDELVPPPDWEID